nr:MAG TPA: hypothetical protein [Caudoviricetes sp.]
MQQKHTYSGPGSPGPRRGQLKPWAASVGPVDPVQLYLTVC